MQRRTRSWAEGMATLAMHYALATATRGDTLAIVDLQPERDTAGLLQRCLQERKGIADVAKLAIEYMPCVRMPHEAMRLAAMGHAGHVLLWDPARPDAVPILCPEGRPWHPRGPVLVIAGSAWQGLRQDTLAVHYGKVLEPDGPEAWRPVQHKTPPEVATYLDCINSAGFTVPAGAFAAATAIRAWSRRGWLLVAEARGWADEKDVRLLRLAITRQDELARMHPVNFDLLAKHHAAAGAVVRTARLPSDNVLQLAMGGRAALPEVVRAFAETLLSAAPPAPSTWQRALDAVAERGDLEATLALLQQACDAQALVRIWPRIASALEAAAPKIKQDWARLLNRVLAHTRLQDMPVHLVRSMADMALACADYRSAGHALAVLDARRMQAPEDALLRARLLACTGRAHAARAICQLALQRQPVADATVLLARELEERVAAHEPPWRVPHVDASTGLVLEPLAPHHAEALAWQYRDPQIATMTGLPAMEAPLDVHAWIADRVRQVPASYALMHPELGFAGFGELHPGTRSDALFLCMWVGADLQGRGLGRPLVRMLCELAHANGVRLILTSAFDDNTRSLRTLRACGMQTMRLRGLPPNHGRTFLYHAAPSMPEAEAERELVAYMSELETPLEIEPGTGAGAAVTHSQQPAPDAAFAP